MNKLFSKACTDISQTFFIRSRSLGFLILICLCFESIYLALAGLLGAMLSIKISEFLKPNKILTESGLFGMNGFFFATGLMALFENHRLLWLWILIGAFLTTYIVLFVYRLFMHWQFPILGLPYVISLSMIWILRTQIQSFKVKTLPPIQTLLELPIALKVVCAGLNGLSDIFFLMNPWAGFFLMLILFFIHRRAGCWAIWGSLIGSITAYILGFPEEAILRGLFGFSSALVCVALSVGYKNFKSFELVGSAIAAVIFMGSVSQLGFNLGLLALGLPYTLLVWVMISIKPVSSQRVTEEQNVNLWNPKVKVALDKYAIPVRDLGYSAVQAPR